MRLHDYPASGNCYKVRLLLALLGRDYERVTVDIFAGGTLTPEYRELNPTRRTPVLELDDGEAIAQSNAILFYLGTGTPFVPEDAVLRARVVEWLLFDQEWVLPGIALPRFMVLTERAPLEAVGESTRVGRRALRLLDRHLAERPFVVGDAPSIADVSLYGYVHVAGDVGLEPSEWPAVERWLGRVESLPGFMDDLAPYPENSRPGVSQSIWDPR